MFAARLKNWSSVLLKHKLKFFIKSHQTLERYTICPFKIAKYRNSHLFEYNFGKRLRYFSPVGLTQRGGRRSPLMWIVFKAIISASILYDKIKLCNDVMHKMLRHKENTIYERGKSWCFKNLPFTSNKPFVCRYADWFTYILNINLSY